jgi:tripartite-type tricarboxylate transporter receptor subunit TctC
MISSQSNDITFADGSKKLSMTSANRALLRTVAITLAGFALSLSALHPACAQTRYPDKPVRIVLPFAAGGVADITARIVAEKLGDRLGQRFYVENQPGAGGIAAARTVISSPPDGQTLALLSNGTAVSVSLFKKLPFDPLKDFEPISSLGYFDFIFATAADSEFRTLGDFIAAAKAKPGALNVGTINVGSTQNLSAELTGSSARWRRRVRHVPKVRLILPLCRRAASRVTTWSPGMRCLPPPVRPKRS